MGKGVPEDDSPGWVDSGALHAALTNRTATIMSSDKPEAFADMVESANLIFIFQLRIKALPAMAMATGRATATESALVHWAPQLAALPQTVSEQVR